MKLRTTDNSIRIRIRKSELANLSTNRAIESRVHFGGGIVFTFALVIADDFDDLHATFEAQYLKLSIPSQMAAAWIKSDQVGLEHTYMVEENTYLHLLVEKDFPCIDREGEDKADFFGELVEKEKKEEQC